MRKPSKTKYYSWKTGSLPKGCQLCVKGEKLVLVVTGICSQNCYYCPLSGQKKNKDLVWANEWQTNSLKNIFREAELTDAKGAGFTGGDPLIKLQRTLKLIKALKNRFGKKFHIHLYTPLSLVNHFALKKLHKAGLDEIRFHPNFNSKKFWNKIFLARNFKWSVGVEIPVIPEKKEQTLLLIDYIKNKIDFLNLNELEISDANSNHLLKKGFKVKNQLSYAVKGSDILAKQLLNYCSENTKLNVHYCTAKLKDGVQLKNRIIRRAKHIALDIDLIDDDGILVRGCIYLPEEPPGFRNCSKSSLNKLIRLRKRIVTELHIKDVFVDRKKPRLLIAPEIVLEKKKHIKELGLIPAIVEEYPTHDALEVEVTVL